MRFHFFFALHSEHRDCYAGYWGGMKSPILGREKKNRPSKASPNLPLPLQLVASGRSGWLSFFFCTSICDFIFVSHGFFILFDRENLICICDFSNLRLSFHFWGLGGELSVWRSFTFLVFSLVTAIFCTGKSNCF